MFPFLLYKPMKTLHPTLVQIIYRVLISQVSVRIWFVAIAYECDLDTYTLFLKVGGCYLLVSA